MFEPTTTSCRRFGCCASAADENRPRWNTKNVHGRAMRDGTFCNTFRLLISFISNTQLTSACIATDWKIFRTSHYVLITCYRHSADILLPAPAGKIFIFFKNVAQQQNWGGIYFFFWKEKEKGSKLQLSPIAPNIHVCLGGFLSFFPFPPSFFECEQITLFAVISPCGCTVRTTTVIGNPPTSRCLLDHW